MKLFSGLYDNYNFLKVPKHFWVKEIKEVLISITTLIKSIQK